MACLGGCGLCKKVSLGRESCVGRLSATPSEIKGNKHFTSQICSTSNRLGAQAAIDIIPPLCSAKGLRPVGCSPSLKLLAGICNLVLNFVMVPWEIAAQGCVKKNAGFIVLVYCWKLGFTHQGAMLCIVAWFSSLQVSEGSHRDSRSWLQVSATHEGSCKMGVEDSHHTKTCTSCILNSKLKLEQIKFGWKIN